MQCFAENIEELDRCLKNICLATPLRSRAYIYKHAMEDVKLIKYMRENMDIYEWVCTFGLSKVGDKDYHYVDIHRVQN